MDPLTLILTIIFLIAIAGLVAGIVLYLYRVKRRRSGSPSHIELYFDENFRALINEWDLQTRPKIKDWRVDMQKRLATVAGEIERLKTSRQGFDTRLERLERDLSRLERF